MLPKSTLLILTPELKFHNKGNVWWAVVQQFSHCVIGRNKFDDEDVFETIACQQYTGQFALLNGGEV